MTKRTSFSFGKRYCLAHKGTYGWVDTGEGPLAKTELVERLKMVMMSRSRKEIWKDTPPKTRQVIRVPVPSGSSARAAYERAQKSRDESHYFAALEATLPLKREALLEQLLPELIVGGKSIVWCLTRESVETVIGWLEKACSSKANAPALRERHLQLWATHGGASSKSRNEVARDFRMHEGSGVIVVTMDAMPVAISLLGAETQHMIQLHWSPGTLRQAEDRAYGKDVRGLHSCYYVAEGTADVDVEQTVLPRLDAMAGVVGDEEAGEIRDTLNTGKEVESFDDWISRLTASAVDGRGDMDNDVDVEDGDVK